MHGFRSFRLHSIIAIIACPLPAARCPLPSMAGGVLYCAIASSYMVCMVCMVCNGHAPSAHSPQDKKPVPSTHVSPAVGRPRHALLLLGRPPISRRRQPESAQSACTANHTPQHSLYPLHLPFVGQTPTRRRSVGCCVCCVRTLPLPRLPSNTPPSSATSATPPETARRRRGTPLHAYITLYHMTLLLPSTFPLAAFIPHLLRPTQHSTACTYCMHLLPLCTSRRGTNFAPNTPAATAMAIPACLRAVTARCKQ